MSSWRIRFHDKWPHMSSLYSGGTSREDEEQKYVDPAMVFDNVYENPSEPYGAYKFYMAPREEFVIQSEPHLYPVRAVYKEDDDRTSGYATSGGSSTLRDGSSKRILLCVLLIFLLIGAVVAAVVMAVLISHQRRIKPLQPEVQQQDVLESNIRIANRTYIMAYSDPNSQEYKLLETEFCQGMDAMFYRTDSPMKADYKGCKVLSFRAGSVITRFLMTFSWENKKPIQPVVDLVEEFIKETIPKKGIWNPLLLNGESLDIYPVEMTAFKPEIDPNYIKPTEDDTSEKSSVQITSEYDKTKEYTTSSSVLTFQESKHKTFLASDDSDDVYLFSTLSDKEKLFPSQTLHQSVELSSYVRSSKVLSHSTDKLLPSSDYTMGLTSSSIPGPEAKHSDVYPQFPKIPFNSVRANIDKHLQSLLPFLPIDKKAVADINTKNDNFGEPVTMPSKSLHFESTSGINDDFFNFLNSIPSSHQTLPKSSVGRDQINTNDLDILLQTGDFNKFLFPSSAEAFSSSTLEETQASVSSHGDLSAYTSSAKPLLAQTIDQLSSDSHYMDGFSLQSSNTIFPTEGFGNIKSANVLSSLSTSTPPIKSSTRLLPSTPKMKESSIVSSTTFEQNFETQILTSSASQSKSLEFGVTRSIEVTPSDLNDWSDFNLFSGFDQVSPPPRDSMRFSNDLFGDFKESVSDDTQSFFDFFSHLSTNEELTNDRLPENDLMNSAQSGTTASSSPTQDLEISSGQSMFSFLNNVPKGSIKVVDEFDTATRNVIDFGNSLLFQSGSEKQSSSSTAKKLQPSLSRYITEKSDEFGQQSTTSMDSNSLLKSSANEHLLSSTVEVTTPPDRFVENQSSFDFDVLNDSVKFSEILHQSTIITSASSVEVSSLMDERLHIENTVKEILLPSSLSKSIPDYTSSKTVEPSLRRDFSSKNLLPNRVDSIAVWNETNVNNFGYSNSFSEADSESSLHVTALPGNQIFSGAHEIVDKSMKDIFYSSDKNMLPSLFDENEIYPSTKGETMSILRFNPVDESSDHTSMKQASLLEPSLFSISEKYASSLNSLLDFSSAGVSSIGGNSNIQLDQPTKTSTLPLSSEAYFSQLSSSISDNSRIQEEVSKIKSLNSPINTAEIPTTSIEHARSRYPIADVAMLFSSSKEDSVQETLLQFSTDDLIKPTSASTKIDLSYSIKEEGDSDVLSASGTLQLTQALVDLVVVSEIIPEKQTSLSFENLMTISPFDTNVNKVSLNTNAEIETRENSNRPISSSEKAMTSMLIPLTNPQSVIPSSHIMSLNSIKNTALYLKDESVTESSKIKSSEESPSSLSFNSLDVLDFSIDDVVSEVTSTSIFSSVSIKQHFSAKSQIRPSEENLMKDVISQELIPTETLMFSKEMTHLIEAMESPALFTAFSDVSFMNSFEIMDSQSRMQQKDNTSLQKLELESSYVDKALSSLKTLATDIETSFPSNVVINTKSSILPLVSYRKYESVVNDGMLSDDMLSITIKGNSIQKSDTTKSLKTTDTLASLVETAIKDIKESITIPKDTPLSSFTKMESSDDFLPVQTISSLTQTTSSGSVFADFKSSPSIRKEIVTSSNQFENFDNLQASQSPTSTQSHKQNSHKTIISDSSLMFDQSISIHLNNQDQGLSTAPRLSELTEIADPRTIFLDTSSEIMFHSSSSYIEMESLSQNIEKQQESIISTMQPMTEHFIKPSIMKSQQPEVVNTFYNSDITDTSSKPSPDSSFTEMIQSISVVWTEKVALDSSDMSSTLSDTKIIYSRETLKTEYMESSTPAPLSKTTDQEIMTNPLSEQRTHLLDSSSAVEHSTYTKDVFDVFSSSQSIMKLSTDGIIGTSMMKQIDSSLEIKQEPLHSQTITTNGFNSQTFEFSKIETVQDNRLSTDALNMLKDGTEVYPTMSPELLTVEHSSQTVTTETLTSGVFDTPLKGFISSAFSATKSVPGLQTSTMTYSEKLSLASDSFVLGKDTDTDMLVFNTFNELPSKSQNTIETIMPENDLSLNSNNLGLSFSTMLPKEQLTNSRNLQPSMTLSNYVSTSVSNFDLFGIMSVGTPYVESTRSLLDSSITEGLKSTHDVSSSFENLQGSQIKSSQNDVLKELKTSISVIESLNAALEPSAMSLPYSDKQITDTLSSPMETVSFELSDSSYRSPYPLNSDKLNIDSSFSIIQTISREPLVEVNTFSIDTVLQSFYKGSSSIIEDFRMEIKSESRNPIHLSSGEHAATSSLYPNIATQSVDTGLHSIYKGSSTIKDFGMEMNSESRTPISLSSDVTATIGFSSSLFPNMDTQGVLKQTEIQSEVLTSAVLDSSSGITQSTTSTLYVSNSLVEESPTFSSEVNMLGDETLQPLSISPTSPIPDQHISSVSNITQSILPSSVDSSLTKTFDIDKLTSELIVSSTVPSIIAKASLPLNPSPSISSFDEELSSIQTLVWESSSAIPQDTFTNILENNFTSEIGENIVGLNSQILETAINTVNLNDNLSTKSSKVIPSTNLSNITSFSNNIDEHILNSSFADFQLSALSSTTLANFNTADIFYNLSINETTIVNKTVLSLFSSESQIIAPISHTPELFQIKPDSITMIKDPLTTFLSETMTIVSAHQSQAYQSEISSFQFFSNLDNTTAADNNKVLFNDTLTVLDTSYVSPTVLETSSLFPDMNQTWLFENSLSETVSLNTLTDIFSEASDGHLLETISQTLELSTISRVSASTVSEAQSESFPSSSLVTPDVTTPEPFDQTTYDVNSDFLVNINDIEPSLNLESQAINLNTTDTTPINLTPYFVGSDVIFSSFEPFTNLNMHEYVSPSSTQESLHKTVVTNDNIFLNSDADMYDIASKSFSESIETKSIYDSSMLFGKISYGKGINSSVFTILSTSGTPSSVTNLPTSDTPVSVTDVPTFDDPSFVTILPTTSLTNSMLFSSFSKENITYKPIVTSIPNQSSFHQSTIMLSIPIIGNNPIIYNQFHDNDMAKGTLSFDLGKGIQEQNSLQRSILDTVVSYFSTGAFDASLMHTGMNGTVSRSVKSFTNPKEKVSILLPSTINYISSTYIQSIDVLSYHETTIKKNGTEAQTIFPYTNNENSYSSSNILDHLLDPYMETSLNLNSLTHLSINTRIDWLSAIANSLFNGYNRTIESSAEAFSSNVEKSIVGYHYASIYSDDFNSWRKAVSDHSLTSSLYFQKGKMTSLDTSIAAFNLDTSMPYSSIQISNQNFQEKSLSELNVYSDVSNMDFSSSNLASERELSLTSNNPNFSTEDKFPVLKSNKINTTFANRAVLAKTETSSHMKSESSVDTFLFTAANDYDYYATDLDFVTDYVDVTATSLDNSRLDDSFSILNLPQSLTTQLPILSVSNSLARNDVLAKAISGLPINLPAQNETENAKHYNTITSSQYDVDKLSSKTTGIGQETIKPSTQKYPKVDVLMPTPVMTETEKPVTPSDIDFGMDMDYYDPFAAFFGGGGPAIPQWVIDMLGTVHDSPPSSAKHYFRH